MIVDSMKSATEKKKTTPAETTAVLQKNNENQQVVFARVKKIDHTFSKPLPLLSCQWLQY
jgi:hypothetical protein